MTLTDLRRALGHPNVAAFLRVIRAGESSQSDDAYRMMFGGGLFGVVGGWQHPNIVNHAAGLSSTAAGAYQFLYRTWEALNRQYPFPDFAPRCQDMAAVALIAGRGALQDVLDGRLGDAIAKCNREWASLPGSPYGQPVLSLARCRDVFAEYGGTEAGAATLPKNAPESPALDQPTENATMSAGVFAALLPTILQQVPALVQVFGKGDKADKAGAAAEIVTRALTQSTGAVNLQDAVTKIETDPAARTAAQAAVQEKWYELMEVGGAGGGIDRARLHWADPNAQPFWRNGAFIMAAILTPLIYMVVYRVLWGTFSEQLQTVVVSSILSGLLGALTGYFFGAMYQRAQGAQR